MDKIFSRLASMTAEVIGKPVTFIANVIVILVWAGAGPVFHFSDTWQLVVNTGTTVFTYLMLFLLQHTQNRDARALQAKLDEIIKALPAADNRLRGIEKAPD